MNYAEVIEFVRKQTAENGRPPNYPFRSRFEHTMRVYRWAIKLQSKLGGDLDIIVLAALLTILAATKSDRMARSEQSLLLIISTVWAWIRRRLPRSEKS